MTPSGWTMARRRLRGVARLSLICAALWLVLTEGRMPGPEAVLIIAAGVWVGSLYAPRYMYRWRPLRLAAFVGYFLRRSLVGGLDVAHRALHPDMPIEPCIVHRRLRVNLDQPRTLIVAALSLMPGTLAVDVHDGLLTVHLLTRGMEAEVDELEARVTELFQPVELEHDGPSVERRW